MKFCQCLKKIIHLPVDDKTYNLTNVGGALLFSWSLIIIIILFALYSANNLSETVTLENHPSSNQLIQVMTFNQEKFLSDQITSLVIQEIITSDVFIKWTTNFPIGDCPTNTPVEWDQSTAVTTSLIDGFLSIESSSVIICNTQNLNVVYSLVFKVQTSPNWNSLNLNVSSLFINMNPISFLIGTDEISFDSIGLRLIIEDYRCNTILFNDKISTHAIIFNFGLTLDKLLNGHKTHLLGSLPTVITRQPTLIDKLVYFLALSFGLFGVIAILVKFMCYNKSNGGESSSMNVS